jgi:hypothetical protein
MAVDVAVLGISLDTTDVDRGAQAAIRGFGSIGKGAQQMGSAVDGSNKFMQNFKERAEQAEKSARGVAREARQMQSVADAATRGLERQFQQAQADIREAQARGFITPEEAKRRGADAGRAFNQGLLREIEARGASGAFQGAKGQNLFVGLTSQLKDVDVAASKAGVGGIRTLTTNLASMGAQALGARAGIGGIVSALGGLALGSLTALGVIAGIAAIVLLYQHLTKASREAIKAQNDLRLELSRSAAAFREQSQPLEAYDKKLASLGESRKRLEAELKRASQDRIIDVGKERTRNIGPDLKRIAELRIELGKLDEEAQEAGRLAGAAMDALAKPGLRDVAKNARDAAAAQREHNRELEAWILHMNELVPKLTIAKDVAIALAVAQGRAQGNQIFARNQIQNVPYTKDAARLGFIRDPNAIREELRAQQDIIRASAESRREMIRFADQMGLLPRSMVHAASAVSDLIEKIQLGAAKTADYVMAAANILGSLVSGRSVGASAARGAIGGAAVGFAVGGPVGAGIGLVAGGIAGLFGGGKQRKEDIRALQEQQDAFRAQGAGRNAVAELTKQYEALRAEAIRLKQPIGELTASYRSQVAAARAAVMLQHQQLAQDLNVRALRAQGRDAEADAEEFRLQQAREFAAVVEQFKGTSTAAEKAAFDATIATLTYTQALEAEKFAKDQATIAAELAAAASTKAAEAAQELAEKLADEARASQDLDVRFLRGLGQGQAADDLAFDIAQRRELEEAQKRGYSEAYLAQLKIVQEMEKAARQAGELANAVEAVTGASQAFSAVSAVVTDRTALMLIDLTRSEVSLLSQIETNTRGGGEGGSGTTINLSVRVNTLDGESLDDLIDRVKRRLNEEFGSDFQGQQAFMGLVSR